jgi:MFS family permease
MFSVTYNLAVVAFVAITGSFTFGFANSCIGSIQGLDSFLEYFSISETGQYSNTIRGALSGVFAGGSGIGALVLSSITDRWGRVRTLQLTALLCIIGGVIQTSSINVTMLLVGRAISGFGVGMIVALVPIYQSEISPPESRGLLVSSHGVFIVTGYVSHSHYTKNRHL